MKTTWLTCTLAMIVGNLAKKPKFDGTDRVGKFKSKRRGKLAVPRRKTIIFLGVFEQFYCKS